jgi:hypothetical protein
MMKWQRNPYRIGIITLVVILWLVGLHASVLAFLEQPAGVLKEITSPTGIFSLVVYALFCLAGLAAAYATLTGMQPEARFVRPRPAFHWTALTTLALYLAAVFIQIYHPGLRPLLISWFTPLFVAGWLLTVKWIMRFDGGLRPQALSLTDLVSGGILLVSLTALQQVKLAMPPSTFWKLAFFALIALNGAVLVLYQLAVEAGPRYLSGLVRVYALRKRFRYGLYALALVLIALPAWWMFLYDVTGIGSGLGLRLEVLLLVGFMVSILIEPSEDRLTGFQSMALAAALTGYLLMVGAALSQVSANPMALGWSEGNRLYDYSLIFGKSLYTYTGELNPNYFSPGRYGLWGLPFLIPGLPIWAHRLWNALLGCLPGLALGWVLFRDLRDTRWHLTAALTFHLFLNQGPIYASLLIALLILSCFARSKNPWLRIAAVIVASYYAGISRFTWVLVTAAWAGLFDLFLYYPSRPGNWFKRLLPTAGMIVLGFLPGAAFSWPEVLASQGETIQSQALLWYRLLPSSTYPLGVAPGLLIAVCAPLTYLIWLLIKRFWRPDVWQSLAVGAVLVGFLGSGLVASSKIGGGSNLHNMDMFLTSLALVITFAVTSRDHPEPTGNGATVWSKAILIAAILIPAWNGIWNASPLNLPDRAATDKIIAEVQSAADTALPNGEVLFMDERQLLTFGEVTGIPLVADYEKKFMMDQAMAGNASYFDQFYADLRAQRFSLILAETQKVNYQSDKDDFNEENNAWVKWVSEPFLTYYKPIATYKVYGFSLYVPK